MTDFEKKYGYKQYSVNDPQMRIFLDALEYLGVPITERGAYWGGVRNVLLKNDILDGNLWETMTFKELSKLSNGGKTYLTIIVVAQQLKRGEIHI